MNPITWDDFTKVELRVGTIVHAEEFKEARQPAYILQVDMGAELGMKKSSAQVTEVYKAEELIGKQVLAVVNFPPKQIGPMRSEVLVTGLYSEEGVVLIVPDKPVKNGLRLG